MPRLTSLLRCVAESTKKASNLPEGYIKRAMEQVAWKNPRGMMYRRVVVKRKKYHFDVHRPWSQEFKIDNAPGTRKQKVFIEPIGEWSFFKGDQVEVLVGKDKGKQGLVNYMVEERNWVMVEGLNCDYTTVGKTKNYPGMLMKTEQPLLVTEHVALVDPSDNKPCKAEWRYTEEGEKVRVSTRTGRIIPIPKMAEETPDYKTKATYAEQDKDTTADLVTSITFQPTLRTFEMDIAEKMGIKEDRIPHKTYWY
ncbi:probable 39S ribosomal protein L24, mitochondrial [Eriocheir sinensis]|uniref:probable 39S ribosomal protein L24, mitochondrial n=1 Tax=Eriocheir sinensis TaxID=95602 RepID=UPI0021C62099|nr:probable 39S ribosomal protein L24, mitochondrial [Eriocheir sinensis]